MNGSGGVSVAGFDTVSEFDACYQLWQLVLTVEASPRALRDLNYLKDHDHAGVMREAAFGKELCMNLGDGLG
jgi:hypothetical protein